MVEGGGRWTRPYRKGKETEAVFLMRDVLLNFTPFNVVFLLGSIGLAAQLYRYRRVSIPVERQQTRWAVFGIPLGLVLKYATYVPVLLFPTLGSVVLLRWLNIFVYEHLFLCIPLSIGAALLGSRL
jgi:hypothetical protein